jgi:hypothetical protein
MKSKNVDFTNLNERQPTRWRPDPHRRGRIIASKKLYKRKPRTKRDEAFDFSGVALSSLPTANLRLIAIF